MKKIVISFVLIGLSFSSLSASLCKSGETEIQKGNNTFCKVDATLTTERICVGDFSMNPDDPTGTQCIKKPTIISASDASTHTCPSGSSSIDATTCLKKEPMNATSLDSDMVGTWHSYATRNQTLLKLKEDSGTILTEVSNANASIPGETNDIACDEQVYMNALLNNLRYGIYGGASSNDKWEIHFAKIMKGYNDKNYIYNEPFAYKFDGGHFPINNGDGTYPKKIIPSDGFQQAHSYYIMDNWDKLPDLTDIKNGTVAADGYYQQKYTYNLLTATVKMGITGSYDWARGNADNPYLTDKGYIYNLRRALVQMNEGDWIYSQNTAGEAGECWNYYSKPNQKDIVSASCGPVGSGTVNISFSKPTANCGNMLSTESINSEPYTATLTCCNVMGWKEFVYGCKLTCTGTWPNSTCVTSDCKTGRYWGCKETSSWSSTKSGRKTWKAWGRKHASYKKSDITVNDGACDSVDIEKPSLQDDICVPDGSWDNLESGAWNHCSSTLGSTYYYHKDGAEVPSYCSDVGVNKCGALTSETQGSDFAYCSSDPIKNSSPAIGYWIDNVKWWGWDKAYSPLGISASKLKAEFKGAKDAHNQCQKDMCEPGYETCKAANDSKLAAELKAKQEEWAKQGETFGDDGGGGYMQEGDVDISDTSANTNTITIKPSNGTPIGSVPISNSSDITSAGASYSAFIPRN